MFGAELSICYSSYSSVDIYLFISKFASVTRYVIFPSMKSLHNIFEKVYP